MSGGTIWTAYEVLMMWVYANEMIPYVDPRQEPVYMWFGTFHDGSPEAHAAMREKRRAEHNILTEAE